MYTDVFGFSVHAQRREERFAYLTLGDAHIMLQEANGPGRRFRTAPLDPPFGRGVNLQIMVPDLDTLWAAVRAAGLDIVVALEERWYRHNETEIGQRQCVIADWDGYLLRFCAPIGSRSSLPES